MEKLTQTVGIEFRSFTSFFASDFPNADKPEDNEETRYKNIH
jgi:hypothetical protein